jgi:hypothetical protein
VVLEQNIQNLFHTNKSTTDIRLVVSVKNIKFYVKYFFVLSKTTGQLSRPQWLRGIRHESEAARLLELRVRIPPDAWMSLLSVGCCQVEVSALG